jgi:hypothetical protein
MMSWAAQTHLAGHMRPAGRMFETLALEPYYWCLAKMGIQILLTMNRNAELDSLTKLYQGTLNKRSVGLQMSTHFSCFKSAVGISKINISY